MNKLPSNEQITATQPPPEWGHDGLSRFLDATRHNQFATFHYRKSRYGQLATIDGCFYKIATNINQSA